jgi:hypothetical protein
MRKPHRTSQHGTQNPKANYMTSQKTNEHLSSPLLFWWGPCCSYCSFLYCPIMCIRVLSSVLWCPLRFQHKNDIRFVFTPSCFLWRLLSNILCVFVVHNGIHYACADILQTTGGKDDRTSFLCGNRTGHHNTEPRTQRQTTWHHKKLKRWTTRIHHKARMSV